MLNFQGVYESFLLDKNDGRNSHSLGPAPLAELHLGHKEEMMGFQLSCF